MTRKIIYFVPLFLVIISIITSYIAFAYNKNLENAFIYLNNNTFSPEFEGEYYSIVGNLGDNSTYIAVESLPNHLLITIYDSTEIIIKEYTLVIKKENSSYSNSIITDVIGTNLVNIDDIDEYIFTLDLDDTKTYESTLSKTSNNLEIEEIDLVLVNIPEHLLNMKNLNEGIAFTTMVFSVISGITILIIFYYKKTS